MHTKIDGRKNNGGHSTAGKAGRKPAEAPRITGSVGLPADEWRWIDDNKNWESRGKVISRLIAKESSMKDTEKLKALLNEFGVEYSVELMDDGVGIVCRSGNAKVDGYCSFFVEFQFKKDGDFSKIGIWEN